MGTGGPNIDDADQNGDLEATPDVGRYDIKSGSSTHEGAARSPNALGLYGMCGNVWEMSFDWNPLSVGGYRILRGGSWSLTSDNMQIAKPGVISPENEIYVAGFRLSKNLD